MGNLGLRSQYSLEDTDSSLQGDPDEDTGKETTETCSFNSEKHGVVVGFFWATMNWKSSALRQDSGETAETGERVGEKCFY